LEVKEYNLNMPLTPSQVSHIAHLARLELTEEELSQYSEQLSAILAAFIRLQTIETAAPTADPVLAAGLPQGSTLRLDVPRPGLTRDALLRNAPEVESDQIRVPPVLE
jgi:aspartyl-tRNA(Asn)/glutamyl-tRNA(Gln) amidotransferase subunit C